jgi:hypothetical protein
MVTRYRPLPPPGEDVQLAALRNAFPGFSFTVIGAGGKRLFEAVRTRGGGPLYSVMTTDAEELWQIMKEAQCH